MAVRFSAKEVLDLITADDGFGVSDSESSKEEGKGVCATVENAVLVAWTSKAFRK